jgi:hypothetical protein
MKDKYANYNRRISFVVSSFPHETGYRSGTNANLYFIHYMTIETNSNIYWKLHCTTGIIEIKRGIL